MDNYELLWKLMREVIDITHTKAMQPCLAKDVYPSSFLNRTPKQTLAHMHKNTCTIITKSILIIKETA